MGHFIYCAIGANAALLLKALLGHVANRLQAALWQEALYLVKQGVVSVADIDTAIAHGPGLRWALLGPFMNLHLSGGAGGLGHVLEHLGPPIESWWRDLGEVLTEELDMQLVDGVNAELGQTDLSTLMAERDDILLTLLNLKATAHQLP
jgi:3-hydroxyacyl-CoA dehydrogenase